MDFSNCICTPSRLVDELKETWAAYKDSSEQIAGEYYYDMFLRGVLFNKVIDIKVSHISEHLSYHLNRLGKKELVHIIYRAVLETIEKIKGEAFSQFAKNNNRIRWRLI